MHVASVEHPTLFLDERNFSGFSGDVVMVVNNGYEKGLPYTITEPVRDGGPGEKRVAEYDLYCPKVLAFCTKAIVLPESLRERTIPIRQKKELDPDVEDWDTEQDYPEAKEIQARFGRLVAHWGSQRPALDRTKLPPGHNRREHSLWQPMLEIAQYAGPVWYGRVYEASKSLVKVARRASPDATMDALRDICAALEAVAPQGEAVASEDLVGRAKKLVQDGEAVSDGTAFRTAKALSDLMEPFEIYPNRYDFAREGQERNRKRGYLVAPLKAMLASYLGPDDAASTPELAVPRPRSFGGKTSAKLSRDRWAKRARSLCRREGRMEGNERCNGWPEAVRPEHSVWRYHD